jgi:hypothetical protein
MQTRSSVYSLSLKCSKVTLLPELWKIIFSFDFDFRVQMNEEVDYLSLESTLKVVSCVCRSWGSIGRELVREYFKSNYKFSNWVLKQFDSIVTQFRKAAARILWENL